MTATDATINLTTVRDFLRYAVSRFREAKIAIGHGTSNALDEAAFLILETLHLPVDDLNPWLEAKLLPAERIKLLDIIEARIVTRKPAAYLTKSTYIRGVHFYVDERVIVPRSYIGELLFSGLFGGEGHNLIEDPSNVKSVLDLCTGSGCLAILAAGLFSNAEVDAVELSADALEVAKINVRDHDLEDRIRLYRGDLFAPIAKKKYDLIITNPPYVAEAEVAAFPKEYAHEPVMAHVSGKDGLDLTRRILAEVPKHLNTGGGLLCEIGTGREILERECPNLDFFWLDTEESTGEVFWLTF
jgi:ribosomal protein L3 glutamine methyltransferase